MNNAAQTSTADQAKVFRELTELWNQQLAKWVAHNGTDDGFEEWFTKIALPQLWNKGNQN
tara:strand:- start:2031 stop:2210 length:180 start_codon:yes stop_codon:yes gene_type:complete